MVPGKEGAEQTQEFLDIMLRGGEPAAQKPFSGKAMSSAVWYQPGVSSEGKSGHAGADLRDLEP